MNIRKQLTTSALTCVIGLGAAMTAISADEDTTKKQTYDTSTATTAADNEKKSATASQSAAGSPSATGSAARTSSSADNMKSADDMKAGSATMPPVVLLVPVEYATDEKLADGCWVRLYDSKNYGGGVFTLVGDVDVPNMRPGTVTGLEWGPNYDSVEVGPKATFTAWDDENYRDRTAMIGAGQRVADLSQRLRFGEDMESLKVDCQK